MRLAKLRNWRSYHHNVIRRRFLSQQKSPNTGPKSGLESSTTKPTTEDVVQEVKKQQNRLDRLLKRSPKFLHRHVSALRAAPFTHVAAFLLLHELTAIVPLLGLAGAFHYYQWLPTFFSEGAWVVAGVEKFGRYFRRKGWITSDEEHEAERLASEGDASEVEKTHKKRVSGWWNTGEGGVRVVVEFATAYAIVKALLIPRLALSAWAAPWFARWTIIPIKNRYRTLFRRS